MPSGNGRGRNGSGMGRGRSGGGFGANGHCVCAKCGTMVPHSRGIIFSGMRSLLLHVFIQTNRVSTFLIDM